MDTIKARGHPNITGKHRTTFEITREKELTLRGDCIIGVSAERGVNGISEELKDWLRQGNKVRIELVIPGINIKEVVYARGHEDLEFSHPDDIVVRKSDFVCGRTLAIKADKSAGDLDRRFISALKNEGTVLHMLIIPVD